MIMEAGNVASARTPRMPQATRHDAWQAGDAYEQYMGRWSRRIAPRFVDWLSPEPGLDWLDVGCGTGALSEAVLGGSDPGRPGAADPSGGFLATARSNGRPEERRVGTECVGN